MADCAVPSFGSQNLKVTLPGGAVIPVMSSVPTPTSYQVTKALMAQASGAMAPLVPVFNIIDAILSIKDFADAVPGVVTDPGSVVSAISKLAEKVAKLASLIPQLSVPLMLLDLIDLTIEALNGLVSQLEAIVAQEAKIAAASELASQPGNEALVDAVTCATNINNAAMASLADGLGPLGQFFTMINIFLGLLGLGQIPELGALSGDASTAITELQAVVKTLQDIRGTIPI